MGRDRIARDRRGQERGRAAPPPRGGSRGDDLHARRDRTRIAQAAARLIAEHGLTDWSLAKRKAARQLMLPEGGALPSNDDVTQALADHHALFGGRRTRPACAAQREEGLAWMRRLAAWEPLLVGGVAAGWATEHSDVRIELVADDPKAVEIALAGSGVAYAASPPGDEAEKPAGATHLRIATPRATIRLSILTPQQRRNRPRQRRRAAARRRRGRRAARRARDQRALGEPRGGRQREIGEDRVGARALERRSATSSTHARSSSQPLPAAAFSIAYSPETW